METNSHQKFVTDIKNDVEEWLKAYKGKKEDVLWEQIAIMQRLSFSHDPYRTSLAILKIFQYMDEMNQYSESSS